MKHIYESKEVYRAYITLDYANYILKKLIKKIEYCTTITLSNHSTEAIPLLEEIIFNKKIIDIEFQEEEKMLAELRNSSIATCQN